jgi:hypothetical protein
MTTKSRSSRAINKDQNPSGSSESEDSWFLHRDYSVLFSKSDWGYVSNSTSGVNKKALSAAGTKLINHLFSGRV